MKQIFTLLLISSFFITSCSTYKNSQTPDDVYYSPGKGNVQGDGSNDGNNSDYYSTANDQYVRMRVQDPARWSYFDDYNYDYYGGASAFGYGPYYGSSFFSPYIGFGFFSPLSYWNSYYSWNSFYNPYYGGIVVVNGKGGSAYGYTSLRTFNPASYSNRTYYRSANAASFTTPYSYGQTIRRSYNNPNASYYRPTSSSRPQNNSFSQPSRSYSPSTFGTGNGGGSFRSSGGGGGGFSRPTHR